MPARLTAREAGEHGYATAVASGFPRIWGPGIENDGQLFWPHALIDAVAARVDRDELRAHMADLEQVQERCHISRVTLRFLRHVANRSRPMPTPSNQ